MALQEFTYGATNGPFEYDDVDGDAFHTTGQGQVDGAPTLPNHIVRLSDLGGVSPAVYYPVDSVYSTVNVGNPNTLLGIGTWTLLGTLVIGTTTVYFWQRTA